MYIKRGKNKLIKKRALEYFKVVNCSILKVY